MSAATELKQEIEFRLCEADELYFFPHFYKIPVVGRGATPFTLRPYQQEMHRLLADSQLLVTLKARQIGMTTMVGAHALHSAFFNENRPWVIVSANQDAARKVLDRIWYGYSRLPQWLRERGPKMVTKTQTTLTFDNGSYIEAIPSVASTGRGDSVYGTILDEFAYMDYASEVYAAVEPLTYGQIIVISTANGMGNRFHDIWLDAELPDSPWSSVFYPWSVVETRDQEWYEHEFLRFRGQEWLFYQEYPTTAEEAFAKSGRVAFPYELFGYCEWKDPQYFTYVNGDFEAAEVDHPFNLRVFEPPMVEVDEHDRSVRDPNYVIGVDVAEGLEHGDYTSAVVYNANTGEQVATFFCHYPIEILDEFLYALGWWYYWALIVVERNHHGMMPLGGLHNMRYPRIYRMKPLASRRNTRSFDFGWTTSASSKPKMVLDMVHAMRDRQVFLFDDTFKQEASVFVADGKGGYSATEGKHDDFIMASLIGWQGVLEVGRFPTIFVDDKVHPVTFGEVFGLQDQVVKPYFLDVPIGQREVNPANLSFILLPEQNKNK